MSFVVTVPSVVLDPLTIEVLLTHSSGLTRTYVVTRPEAVPYRNTGTRPITDAELAAFQAATTQTQRRAVIKAIAQDRIPEERAQAMLLVNAPQNPPSAAAGDLPPAFTITDT